MILLLNGINRGIVWIGIIHSIKDPIIIDIKDIIDMGIIVEQVSVGLNSGKWLSGLQITSRENRIEQNVVNPIAINDIAIIKVLNPLVSMYSIIRSFE